jgi:hypothetical protein
MLPNSLVKMRPWKSGLAASLANLVGIVHHDPLARIVAKTGAAVKAVRAAKVDVPIAVQARAGQKAGRVVAADDLSKDSRLISN